MHNFKPGDLALLTTVVESVPAGSVVELDRLIPKGECLEQPDGQPFYTACDAWSFSHSAIPEGYLGCVAEKFLMPLRGDFKPDEDDLAEYADISFYDLRTGRQSLAGGRA